ncbi:hypothetical protein [Neptunomonas antarctica]|uniref:DUF1574 domain-containing protein n=1 Tax=Neptunomonas antarctica TaxID=619304 RepID=A0A1N7JAS8_9GAMM|nr:hypothetical protein [Neptunomonas antarctica]SIS46428.1 hypothetical protein SAMN05421760_101869 [Neptunomonas antarctica]
MNTYLKQFSTVTVVLLLAIALLNWATDPFAVWHNRCVEGLNCHKTEAGEKIYLTKAYQWRHVNPDIVILGNSRPELGVNPNSPFFKDKTVYNLAIRGAGVGTQAEYLINLLENSTPERVILSVDFLDFLQRSTSRVNWPPKPSPSSNMPLTLLQQPNPYYFKNNVKTHLATLYSLDTTLASINTLISQRQQTNYTTLEGFNQAQGFIPIVNNEGTRALFEQKRQGLLKRLGGKSFSLTDDAGQSSSLNSLKILIDTLKTKGIKLDLFISPYHQRYLEIINQTGHFELYLAWKQELVTQLSALDFFANGYLLDFSGFNRYTLETVPEGRGKFMKWYWEPSHYREELGEVIIEHILSENTEFRLTPKNITRRLAKERLTIDEQLSTHTSKD